MSSDDEDLFAPAGDARPHDPVKFEQTLKLQRALRYERVGLDVGEVVVMASTPKAVRVRFTTLALHEQWVPRSQIHPHSPVFGVGPGAKAGVLLVTKFWAVKLGAYTSVPGSGRLMLEVSHRRPLVEPTPPAFAE